MAITRDTPSTVQHGSTASPSIASHTISANALVIAWFFRELDTGPTNPATFNGNNMTLLASATVSAVSGMWCYYYEASEGAGSYTVQGDWSGNAAQSYTYVESLTGVVSGAPEAYAADSSSTAVVGGGTWDSGSVSASAFVASFVGNNFTSPGFSSVTVVTQENDFASTARAVTGFLNGAAGSEAVPEWTLDSATGDNIAIAVSVAEAAAVASSMGPSINSGLVGPSL